MKSSTGNTSSDYPILVNDDLKPVHEYFSSHQFSRIFVLCDENTAKHCLPALRNALTPVELSLIEIPSGESNKNPESLLVIYRELQLHFADRYCLLINLGGGVIGDMGGFAAATYLRGISFLQMPTTLLAMVDASVGGKLGVDLDHVKNAIGLFQNPDAVFVHPKFLQTLPWRHLMAGVAEMLKHALLDSESHIDEIFQLDFKDRNNLERLIQSSIDFKRSIVEKDPFESGLRKCLNLGHTAGHSLESYSLKYHKEPMLHGECVAYGLLVELKLSKVKLGFSDYWLDQIVQFIVSNFTLPDIDADVVPEIISLMMHDKKNKDGNIRFALLEDIGKPQWDIVCSSEEIHNAFKIAGVWIKS